MSRELDVVDARRVKVDPRTGNTKVDAIRRLSRVVGQRARRGEIGLCGGIRKDAIISKGASCSYWSHGASESRRACVARGARGSRVSYHAERGVKVGIGCGALVIGRKGAGATVDIVREDLYNQRCIGGDVHVGDI